MERFVYEVYDCPECGTESKKHSIARRRLITLKGIIKVELSVHKCTKCKKHFRVPNPLSIKKMRYGKDVVEEAVRYQGTLQQIEIHFILKYGVRVPQTTIHDWKQVRPATN